MIAFVFSMLPVVVYAGHNRDEQERAIRDRYDWVVFDGEFSGANVAAYALESYFAGGEITKETLQECGRKMGKDVVAEMARHGFTPDRDRIYSGLMMFNNWQDTPLGEIPLPNKWVPYVAVRRVGGDSGPTPNPDAANPNYMPDSVPPNAGFSHVLFHTQGTDGMKGYFSINTSRSRDMWYCHQEVGNRSTYDGWFRAYLVAQSPQDTGRHLVLEPINRDHNVVRIFIEHDLIQFRNDPNDPNAFRTHPVVSGRWERNPWRYSNLFR